MADPDPDPEVAAIAKVNEALSGLAPEVQQRVLRWAAERFGVTVTPAKKHAPPNGGGKGKHLEEEQGTGDPVTFSDFASLYDAANPTSDAEKALVAGYWLQTIQGNSDWKGFSANKEVKNLGHGVGNITVSLNQLIDSEPRLVMQTHKGGKTKQARKKYKLTGEGIKRVKQMLSGSAAEES
jgi:hypothetical protein